MSENALVSAPASDASAPLRTALFERHLAAGARMTAFAGFEMPLHYASSAAPVRDEHMAVRRACGVFDVSHMGQIVLAGEQAGELLQLLFSNDVRRMGLAADGQRASGQYGVLCNEDGGVIDDVIAYRIGEERYIVVTNAANHERDLDWFRLHAGAFEAEVEDARARYAMLALQGPDARELLGPLVDVELPGRMHIAFGAVAGVEALVCGSGYTGEDGVELLAAPSDAPVLWDELVRAGAMPAGLAARDTLRLEACLPLYGNELTPERGPIEAGLGWCCVEETDFVGAQAVAAARAKPPAERLVAFVLEDPGIARAGNAIAGGGVVTSGALSPCLERGIGLAYVPADRAAEGTALAIDVRGRRRGARVHPRPLVPRRAR